MRGYGRKEIGEGQWKMRDREQKRKAFALSRHQLRVSAARRAAWRGRDRRMQRPSPARVGAITRWSIDPTSICVSRTVFPVE